MGITLASVHAQVSWQFTNGPYYANIEDFAIGESYGQVVLYAADSVDAETSQDAFVLKSPTEVKDLRTATGCSQSSTRIFDPTKREKSLIAVEGDGRMNPGKVLMLKALLERKRRQYTEAMNTLKSILATGDIEAKTKRWAVRFLLPIASKLPQANLSQYLIELSSEDHSRKAV